MIMTVCLPGTPGYRDPPAPAGGNPQATSTPGRRLARIREPGYPSVQVLARGTGAAACPGW
eukprot:3757234-Rhodomonas_salina.2